MAMPRVMGVRIIVACLLPHAVARERGPMFSAATLHSLDDLLDAFWRDQSFNQVGDDRALACQVDITTPLLYV